MPVKAGMRFMDAGKAGILLRGRVGDAYAAPPATDLPDRAAQRATSDRAAQRDHFYSFLGPYINSWAANSTAFISSTHYGLSQPRARVSTADSASPGLASRLHRRLSPTDAGGQSPLPGCGTG